MGSVAPCASLLPMQQRGRTHQVEAGQRVFNHRLRGALRLPRRRVRRLHARVQQLRGGSGAGPGWRVPPAAAVQCSAVHNVIDSCSRRRGVQHPPTHLQQAHNVQLAVQVKEHHVGCTHGGG